MPRRRRSAMKIDSASPEHAYLQAGSTPPAADPLRGDHIEAAVTDRVDRRDASRRRYCTTRHRRPGPRVPGAKGARPRNLRDQFRLDSHALRRLASLCDRLGVNYRPKPAWAVPGQPSEPPSVRRRPQRSTETCGCCCTSLLYINAFQRTHRPGPRPRAALSRARS